jgi:hypothetical protein
LLVLYLQFVHEYTGVHKTFPYLVASNIILSLTPGTITLYDIYFGGPLNFSDLGGECFIVPQSYYIYILSIPCGTLLMLSCYMTIKVYLVFKDQLTTLANVDYKTLFTYPAVLFLLDVPISIDDALNHPFLPLTIACMVLFKSVGLINAIQFRKATNSKDKLLKESINDVILRTVTQDGESSFQSKD